MKVQFSSIDHTFIKMHVTFLKIDLRESCNIVLYFDRLKKLDFFKETIFSKVTESIIMIFLLVLSKREILWWEYMSESNKSFSIFYANKNLFFFFIVLLLFFLCVCAFFVCFLNLDISFKFILVFKYVLINKIYLFMSLSVFFFR